MWRLPELTFANPAVGKGLVVKVTYGEYKSDVIFVPKANGGITVSANLYNQRYLAKED